MPDPAAAGRAALAAGRWRDAADAFETAVAQDATAESLHGLGAALWWLGEQRRHVALLTAAYAGFRRARDDAAAVQIALDLCCTYKSNFGNTAAAGGWLRRAERLVLAAEPGPLQGWVWLMRAYLAPHEESSTGLAHQAVDSARGGGDRDLELCALSTLGHALVLAGQGEEGLRLVDEAMAATLAGDCERFETTAFTCCEMLDACDAAGDRRRAIEWSRVAEDFTIRYGSPYMYVRCRVLYAGLLARAGRLDGAESELRAALAAVDGAGPAWRAQVLAALAGLRLCRGDREEAEALVAACEGHEAAAEAIAAVQLATGEPEAALQLLRRAVGTTHGTRAAALLGLLVRAHLAHGDVPAATEVAARLAEFADPGAPADVRAAAAMAAGRVALSGADAGAAAEEFERAASLFTAGEAVLDAARARVELARALATAQPAAAIAEARTALACFDRCGATTDADAAAALLRTLGVAGRTGPRELGVLSRREQSVLRFVALGLSNPEIAERLHITRKTAAHHVSHVLTKLDLPNRAAAAAWAASHDVPDAKTAAGDGRSWNDSWNPRQRSR